VNTAKHVIGISTESSIFRADTLFAMVCVGEIIMPQDRPSLDSARMEVIWLRNGRRAAYLI
jgi:hypothetical protein